MASLLIYPATAPHWNASWIAPAGVETTPNVYFRARHTFLLPHDYAESGELHIAAESAYQLWINGAFVGRGGVRGTKTVNFFDTYAVRSALCPGAENTIVVLVSCANVPSFKHAPARPALLVQLDSGTAAMSGSGWVTQIAPEWKPDVPLYNFQMGFMEWCDTRLTGNVWLPAQVVAPANDLAGKRLCARDIPALEQKQYAPVLPPVLTVRVPAQTDAAVGVAPRMTDETHTPLSLNAGEMPFTITPHDGGGVALIFDFGREVVTGFSLTVDAPAGTVVDVGYEEERIDNRLRLTNTKAGHGYWFADRFVLRGGKQVLENTHERGYRFLQLTFREFDNPVILHDLQGVDRRYPVPASAATFYCSDPALNRLWAVCRETLSACATDTFIDCPWRESALWVNDLVVESPIWLRAFGDGRLNARSLRLALSQPTKGGLIPGVCPTDNNDRHVLIATNLFFPFLLTEYLRFTGDESLVVEALPAMERVFAVAHGWENANGLIVPPTHYWNFVDWSYRATGVDVNLDGKPSAVVCWFHVLGLQALAQLCEAVGDPAKATIYYQGAERVARATHAAFWNPDRARYAEFVTTKDGVTRDGSQLTHALALVTGYAPPAVVPDLREALHDESLLTPELYMHHFVFRALADAGYYDVIRERLRRYWEPMTEGASSPTIWEANVHEHGKAAFSESGSLCHGFACTPIETMQAVILGVTPLTEGYATFRVTPQSFHCDFASGTVPTPHGSITVAWTRNRTANTAPHLVLHLGVPEGCMAVVPSYGAATHCAAGEHVLHIAERPLAETASTV